MIDDSCIWDFDVLQFYLAVREEFLRRYLAPTGCLGYSVVDTATF